MGRPIAAQEPPVPAASRSAPLYPCAVHGIQSRLLPSLKRRSEGHRVVAPAGGRHPLVPFLLSREIQGLFFLGGKRVVCYSQTGEGILAQLVRPFDVPHGGCALGQKVAGQAEERDLHYFGLEVVPPIPKLVAKLTGLSGKAAAACLATRLEE